MSYEYRYCVHQADLNCEEVVFTAKARNLGEADRLFFKETGIEMPDPNYCTEVHYHV